MFVESTSNRSTRRTFETTNCIIKLMRSRPPRWRICHTMFDLGVFSIADDFAPVGLEAGQVRGRITP
jgi:hypothetical protein